MLNLKWTKCKETKWCELIPLVLEEIKEKSGVYVIWHGGQTPKWVRVGSGNIKDRLSAHRTDPEILTYRSHGLFVSWAAVPESQQAGVEAYLAAQCNPLVGERFPDRTPLAVNLPQ